MFNDLFLIVQNHYNMSVGTMEHLKYWQAMAAALHGKTLTTAQFETVFEDIFEGWRETIPVDLQQHELHPGALSYCSSKLALKWKICVLNRDKARAERTVARYKIRAQEALDYAMFDSPGVGGVTTYTRAGDVTTVEGETMLYRRLALGCVPLTS